MKRCSCFLQRGLTLLELSVVLLVLIALAGLMVPYVVGTGQMAMCRATNATMQAVKEAIMGGSAGPGYYMDTLGRYPSPKDAPDKYGLHYLFVAGGRDEYNPKTAVGWRGPYLTSGGTTSGDYDGSFGAIFDPSSKPNGTVHIDHNDPDDPGLHSYHVFDAWGRPIVLQVPHDGSDYLLKYARLVSAGPGNGIKPGDAAINTKINDKDASDRNDDRVLYLRMPDPGRNEPCDNY